MKPRCRRPLRTRKVQRMLSIQVRVRTRIRTAKRVVSLSLIHIYTVTGKLELIEQATKAGTRIISCMGAGDKIHADKLEVTDIYKTSGCPLARVMRYELRKRRIRKLKVVYSNCLLYTSRCV